MIIGLCGKKGCGKSSTAESMERNLGFTTLSFSPPIKDALRAIGVPHDALNDVKLKEQPLRYLYGNKTPRELMQIFGTEFARNMISQSIWIDCLIERMRGIRTKDFVIDDIRFDNEAEALKLEGAYIVEVKRDDSYYTQNDLHVSEHGINPDFVDYTLDNVSCYRTDLDNAVESLINKINVEHYV